MGILKEDIDPRIVELIFGKNVNKDLKNNLSYSVKIDQAHIIMLNEQGILRKKVAAKLLKEINGLIESDFDSLKGRQANRGWYLLYEQEIIKRLGDKIGGNLHVGRSRNDLHATIFRLKIRDPFVKTVENVLFLRSNLLKLSKRYKNLIFPMHTQMQPAIPSTFGHYFLAIDQTLNDDLDFLLDSFKDVEKCPLGAGSIAGTSFPINPNRTAELLGFKESIKNSIQSVASYNYILKILSALMILNVTISRFSSDLHIWMTKEFNYASLPDHLKGSSSMMPQKDNPFLIEHIKGKSSANIGFLVSASSAMQKVAFSNAIEVKKEGAPFIWFSFEKTNEILELLNILVEDLHTKDNIYKKDTIYQFILSTSLAEYLTQNTNLSFRESHKLVGEIVYDALKNKKSMIESAKEKLKKVTNIDSIEKLFNISNVVKRMEYGGGPGPKSFEKIYNNSISSLKKQKQFVKEKKDGWSFADKNLRDNINKII